VHRTAIKHVISSVLNISEQSSGLSLNNKKSFRTETFARVSLCTQKRSHFIVHFCSSCPRWQFSGAADTVINTCLNAVYQIIITRCSAISEEPQLVLRQLKSCQLLHDCTKKNHILKMLATGERATLKVTQGHPNCHYSLAIYHFLLVICSNNDSIAPFPRYYHTFTVYVTACDLEKSTFAKKVEVTSHVRFPIHL